MQTRATRPPRPLFVLPDLAAGGAEQSTLRLVGDLARRGFAPTLFLLRRRGELLAAVPENVPVTWALPGDARLHRNAPRIIARLLRTARANDVVIGALELEATYFAAVCAKAARRPIIGWVHAVMSEHLQELSPVHTRLARLVYPHLDQLVFPSAGAAQSLASIVPLRAERIAVIPSYLDLGELAARAAGALPTWAPPVFAAPTVIAIGRLVSSKGIDGLIRAHARVRAAGLDHRLLIVGEGPMRASLTALAESLGVADSVLMPGYVADPLALLRAATVFALASRFEGFSLVLLEALGVGTPIVATDCPGGPAEVLGGGRYGLMVPRDDDAALAEAIARLLNDAGLRDALRVAGLGRVREFGSDAVVPRWQELLTRH